MIKPVSHRFDEGFLARPAGKKTQWLVILSKRTVRRVFPPGKKPHRNILGIAHDAHPFDIHPDIQPGGKSKDRNIIGVRHVELQIGARETPPQGRLPTLPVNQFDIFRAHIQTFSEQTTQARPGNDKPAAIAIEGKTTGFLLLHVGEQRSGYINRFRLDVQWSQDNFNFIGLAWCCGPKGQQAGI